jgi:ketosteroid isomerase-like protein
MCPAFPRSEYYQRVRLPLSLLSPSGWSIRLTYSACFPGRDGSGSPRCHDASVSAHAVLLDPAGVSNDHRLCGRLLLPSRFSTLSASGCVTRLNRFTCVTAWTGGVRTYAAEGATVVVHSSAGDYVRAVLGQRHAVEPDRLELACRDGRQIEPAVMFVEDAITLTDGTREIKLYHVPNLHTSGMLVGYVPDARVLFTADLVSDTFPLIPPLASSVYELIQKNGLSVEMIACGHGNAMPYAQLAYALGKSAKSTDTAEIKALEQRLIDGIKAKDVKQIMSCYSDDLFAYDVVPPRQYVGAAAFQKPWQGFLGIFKGPINVELNDLMINSDGEIAYSCSVQLVTGTTNEGKPFDSTFRIKDVYRKRDGKWVIVQEHISLPPDVARW